MQRVVLHVDMDAFFASVECLGDPRLHGRPVIVGGKPGSRAVVAAASYEARAFGIEAGMSVGEAYRRCPHGEFLGGNPSKYVYYSIRMLEVLRGFTPMVEPFSIDEAFVELTGQVPDLAAAGEIARSIKARVHDRYQLTVTVGVAPNKLVAKMASKIDKPDGLTVIDISGFRRHFWPRPTQNLWGVGEKTGAALARLRIHTIGELAQASRAVLHRAFGVIGGQLRAMARGDDATPLIPYFEGVSAKSVGHEFTLADDEDDCLRLESHLLRLIDQVCRRLRKAERIGRTVILKIRFSDFKTITRQRTLEQPTAEEQVVFAAVRDLLAANLDGRSVRLVGVSVTMLTPAAGASGFLFEHDLRTQEMAGLIDGLRDRFGENVLMRARVMGLRRHRGGAARKERRTHARSTHRGSFPRRGPRQL